MSGVRGLAIITIESRSERHLSIRNAIKRRRALTLCSASPFAPASPHVCPSLRSHAFTYVPCRCSAPALMLSSNRSSRLAISSTARTLAKLPTPHKAPARTQPFREEEWKERRGDKGQDSLLSTISPAPLANRAFKLSRSSSSAVASSVAGAVVSALVIVLRAVSWGCGGRREVSVSVSLAVTVDVVDVCKALGTRSVMDVMCESSAVKRFDLVASARAANSRYDNERPEATPTYVPINVNSHFASQLVAVCKRRILSAYLHTLQEPALRMLDHSLTLAVTRPACRSRLHAASELQPA
ncbi:hypothetical protein MRB53_039737 [Persea americana]|nr:hypothetical protein MRB53_039737 [Persea americana]